MTNINIKIIGLVNPTYENFEYSNFSSYGYKHHRELEINSTNIYIYPDYIIQ